MTTRIRGEEYRTILVCIDSYDHDIPQGRFYSPYLNTGTAFQSLTQLLLEIERLLSTMDFPKAFTVTRSFSAPPEPSAKPPNIEYQMGAKATFAIKILFRQNASWQGSVTWLEGKQEQSFRSVLELIFLIDSAVNSKKAS